MRMCFDQSLLLYITYIVNDSVLLGDIRPCNWVSRARLRPSRLRSVKTEQASPENVGNVAI